ncbi:MAG: phosphoribosyltransferase [Gemmatimonadota bacterium]
MSRFLDRREAGRILAKKLMKYAGRDDVIVLALPRGGVPIGFEVATALHVPLDVFTVRKIGHPLHEELAIGAIASGGVQLLDHDLLNEYSLSSEIVQHIIEREQRELERRERLFRDERPFPYLVGKTVLLVDDGFATGASARSAIHALRRHQPAAIVAAAPVGSVEACEVLAATADECVCVETPEPFYGVGLWYYDFEQTSDAEVLALLHEADARPVSA